MLVPTLILKQLYTSGSLANVEGGVAFGIKNRLSDATIEGVTSVAIAGKSVPLTAIRLDLGDRRPVMMRCMGTKRLRLMCDTCRRLPREAKDEDADKWIEPPKDGPCEAWRDERKAKKR